MTVNNWGTNVPVPILDGGTNATSLTQGSLLLGNDPVSGITGTNGQIPIGNTGADPEFATPSGISDEIAISTGANSLTVGIATDVVLPGTASTLVPSGTTAQRPTPQAGMIRYNSTTSLMEGYTGTQWTAFADSGAGGFVLLGNVSAVGTTLSLTSSHFSDSYDRYLALLSFYNTGSAAANTLLMQVTNPTVQTTNYTTTSWVPGSAISAIQTDGWRVTTPSGTMQGSAYPGFAQFWMRGWNDSVVGPYLVGTLSQYDGSTTVTTTYVQGRRSNAVVNGLRFTWTVSTTAQVLLYGIQND